MATRRKAGVRAQHLPAYRRLCGFLRDWRKAAGLTQRALAARLRKPYSFVFKCEVGDRRIDPIEFVAWCRACGIEPSKVIDRLE